MIRLPDSRYETIKDCIITCFERSNISTFPVKPSKITESYGITLKTYSQHSEQLLQQALGISNDGFSIFQNDSWFIFYNPTIIPLERRRFTLMHEIGHVVLNHTEHSELAEAEADFFARYALAPTVLIQSLPEINEYAIHEKFGISITAAKNALENYMKWRNHFIWIGQKYTETEKRFARLFNIELLDQILVAA